MFLLPKTSYQILKTKRTGRGVYACKTMAAGTVIGDYLGKVVDPKTFDMEKKGMYSLWLNFDTLVYADPTQPGVQLVNHSCEPNCGLFPYQDRMLLIAIRRIFKQEQLTFNYLVDPPQDHEEFSLMIVCRCGSAWCRGTLHGTTQMSGDWEQFLVKTKKKYRFGQLYPVGSKLSPLSKYPSAVPVSYLYDMFGSASRPPLVLSETKLGSLPQLFAALSRCGRRLAFPKFNLVVCGIQSRSLICKILEPMLKRNNPYLDRSPVPTASRQFEDDAEVVGARLISRF